MRQHNRRRAIDCALLTTVLAGMSLGLGCQSSNTVSREVSLVPPKVIRQASAEQSSTKVVPASKSIMKIAK